MLDRGGKKNIAVIRFATCMNNKDIGYEQLRLNPIINLDSLDCDITLRTHWLDDIKNVS